MENNNEILVEVKNVSKKFSKNLNKSLRYGLSDVFRALFNRSPVKHLRPEEFYAVKDVNFTLKRGECIGLIGHNGAGKSTLLKILNGLIRPDEGEVIIRGKVSALIELGAGFNPILTGRENIYVNGQILGFSKKEIDNKIQRIIDFSEIESFIDSPVQNYSSGMKVRLGFAIAAQMEPDVLIIDEVLAVGDLGFILKCFNVIDQILPNTAVIFVSHNMPMVSRICSYIVLMENGLIKFSGNDVAKGIDLYYSKFTTKSSVTFRNGEHTKFNWIKIGKDNETTNQVNWGESLTLTANFSLHEKMPLPICNFIISDKEKRPLAVSYNFERIYKTSQSNELTNYECKVTFEAIELSKGVYNITFVVSEGEGSKPLLRVQDADSFQIIDKKDVWPPFRLKGKWGLKEIQ
jgi:lipopolysaccharide transport system ATP-binding protein